MAVSKRGDRYTARVYHRGEWVWAGTFEEEDDAVKAFDALTLELKGVPTTAAKLTCDEFADHWVARYPRAKDSTNTTNLSKARVFSRDFRGVKMRAVDRPTARAWVLRHPDCHGPIRAMFNDAMNDGLIATNPFAKLGIPKSRGRKDLVVLEPDEVAELADIAREYHGKDYGPVMAALITFAAYTTMRPGEIFPLEWSDMDLVAGEIHVQRRVYKGKLDLPKNGRTRRIILPPPARERLRAMPRAIGTNLVFVNKVGGMLSQTTLWSAWTPVRALFGRPGMDFYELRHFGATHLLEIGASAEDVAVQLGHTDGGKLVRELYGHPSEDRARDRLRRAFQTNVTELRPVQETREATQ